MTPPQDHDQNGWNEYRIFVREFISDQKETNRQMLESLRVLENEKAHRDKRSGYISVGISSVVSGAMGFLYHKIFH